MAYGLPGFRLRRISPSGKDPLLGLMVWGVEARRASEISVSMLGVSRCNLELPARRF